METLEALKPAIEQFTKSALDKIGEQAKRVDDLEMRQRETRAELLDVERKLADRPYRGGMQGASGFDLKRVLEDHAGFQALRTKNSPRCRIELPPDFLSFKAPQTSTTDAAVTDAQRLPGIVVPAQRRLTIRDLLPVRPLDVGSVEYVRETAFTNNAAPVAEGAVKPESSFGHELVTAHIRTLAHWSHHSVQILDDVPALRDYIRRRLEQGLLEVEEAQLLNGSGTGQSLPGLMTLATPFDTDIDVTLKVDRLRAAITQLEVAGYQPTGIVVHPHDLALIELTKTTDGAYLYADPQAANRRSLWGVPLVVTPAMAVGSFLLGDFISAATLLDRQSPTLDIATQDQDDFVKNLVKLRLEERVGLAIELPGALITGTLDVQTTP